MGGHAAAPRALVIAGQRSDAAPWEILHVPEDVDGSAGAFRAPASSCILGADNDYDAIQAWLSLHETTATKRAYRKEAERLILWAIVVRGKALSSLTTKDATDYRAFLRKPTPRERWVGPPRPRHGAGLAAIRGQPVGPLGGAGARGPQCHVPLAGRTALRRGQPFAGIKVRRSQRALAAATTHAFTEGEWLLVRAIANGLEWSYGWEAPAAQRLRFLLDFSYATGLRIRELTEAALRNVEVDAAGDHWLHVIGKGGKPAKVTLTPLARVALERYLQERGLPVGRAPWD